MWFSIRFLLLWTAAMGACLAAGPVDFGVEELNRAIADRGLRPGTFRYRAEINSDPPESFRIEPPRISGGDLRGLMYGLLEAAAQVRRTGRLTAAKGGPATKIRGIRTFLHNRDLEEDWYYSRDYWEQYFAMLARNRFNRFNLVFAHQTNYLAPPYPFWVFIPAYPGIHVPGLAAARRARNLEMLRFISQSAADHGIDFTLGIWEHNIQPRMTPTVEGLTAENIGPYSYLALKQVLAACPAIRSVQMRTNSESGIPKDRQVGFYRDWVYKAMRETGRRVVLDLRGWLMQPGMLEAAESSGLPLRLSSKYWAEFLGRPYQPYIHFLEKPRPYEFYWELWGLGSNRLLLWGDPEYVRRAVPTFALSGSAGFEIDAPLSQRGFGNRPGKYGIFADSQSRRVFWNHQFERYWMFYLLWGRLSYDPKTPERVWMDELRRRFGPAAAAGVLDAYTYSSRALNEIVASHMENPNMYVWPEISPGKRVDEYAKVPPSDWRLIASPQEAVRNRLRGTASAKQSPRETALLLDELAAHAERATARAAGQIPSDHAAEWLGTESDFRVLAALARYHARKMLAAESVAEFQETHGAQALGRAATEIEKSAVIWRGLARYTEGLYPPAMAYGPADTGHWQDKLTIIEADREVVEELRREGPLTEKAALPDPRPRTAAPDVTHIAPPVAVPGQPLGLKLHFRPAGRVKTVRLHYRPLNALEKFRTLESSAASPSFLIPAADVTANWDLLYYFELLDGQGSACFYPDPFERTPYFVVSVESHGK
ncbi:MAG: hypothetical protein NTY38_22515 [Acidobacteria bacterium]|nr:hypothetical protein [Acidobacteriota bacterium]